MNSMIAIDGYAASGKGTIAKAVAKHLGFSYLDTGLIYRAVAQIALLRGQAPISERELIDIARAFKPEYLRLENLRTETTGAYASKIAALPGLRLELVKFQRSFALKSNGVVMDGRDIGSVILPDAQLKVFVTADLNIRANRRFKQLLKCNGAISFDEVCNDLSERDRLDKTRRHAPLKISSDAHLIDTSELSIEASVALVVNLFNESKKKD